MSRFLDPKPLGLTAKTIVEDIDRKTLAIVVKRKSRIIMDDGKKIMAKVAVLRKARPGTDVILKTSTPICSKTLKYFENKGLKVIKD